MKIHAIQTGTVKIKQAQRVGRGQGSTRLRHILFDSDWTAPLPIYAWAIEHPEGVIVVDTGETAHASQPGYFPWWHPYYRTAVREQVKPDDEIGPQLKRLGISPDDVRWVVMTHMHTDHAGGLHHFPKSAILVSRREMQATAGFQGRLNGYVNQHFPTWLNPHLVDFAPQPVGTFPESFTLTQAGDVLLIPTPGHSAGHLSVILKNEGRSILLAGDTSYTEQYLLDQVMDGVSPDEQAARQTLQRLLSYLQATPTIYLPSHDPESAQRLTARQVTNASQKSVSA